MVGLCLGLNGVAITVFGQQEEWLPEEQPDSCYLGIGQQVPNFVLHPTKANLQEAHLSDYRAELTILDFWSVYCAPCIKAFPKMDSLQKNFPEKLKIVLINPNGNGVSAVKTDSVLQRFEKLWSLKIELPSMYMDIATTNKFFYMVTVPHYIWLNKDMEIIATTSQDEVNKKNIEALLNGGKIVITIKPANLDKPENKIMRNVPLSLTKQKDAYE